MIDEVSQKLGAQLMLMSELASARPRDGTVSRKESPLDGCPLFAETVEKLAVWVVQDFW